MRKTNNFKPLKADPEAHKKLMCLKKRTELEQGVDRLSMQELTRRVVRTQGFSAVEREVITDARAKKRIGLI